MRVLWLTTVLLILMMSSAAASRERANAVGLYAARMTTNVWEETFNPDELDFTDSYLLTLTLSRRLGEPGPYLNYGVELQIGKHFNREDHWEFNALGTLRWEPFWWDETLDTSLAFGLGPSYATEVPEIEIETDGESQRFLVYWMLELAFRLPQQDRYELFTRIHHRSGAYGLVADKGGGNALALGLRYYFD